MKCALTIAGSDSSGGAGIQADLKTMTLNHVYAMSAITALTAQNTTGVTGILNSSPEFLQQQIDAVFTDIRPDAVKIGMVSSRELIHTIVDRLTHYQAEHIVVDPVMVATSGARLIDCDAIACLKEELLPLAEVITPNIPESEELWGEKITSKDDMILAADVDGSGEVDANDLTLLSRYVAKIIDSFDQADEQPAEQTQHGGTSSDPQPSSEPQTQEDPVYAANGYLKGIKASEYVTVADPASISVTKAEIDAAVKEMLANLTDDGNVPAWTDDFVKTAFYNVYGWSTTSEAEAGIAATLAHSKYVSAASWLKDVPAELVTDTYNELVANAEAEVAAQGKDLDSYAAELGLGSADELKQLYKLQAEANVKVTFIYQALAERNGYEPTEADIRAYFNNNTGSEDYSAYEADYGLPYIKAVVLSDKMEELIITSATIGS